jgi:type VI secretion system protein ImpG
LGVQQLQLSQQIDVADAQGTGAIAVLTAPVRCVGMTKLGQLDPQRFRTLRFYLGGEGHAPFSLRDRLLNDVVRIEVRQHPTRPDSKAIILARNEAQARRILRPVGFEQDQGVLPRPQRALLGHANLREYFGFPQKYLFVDLDTLEAVVPWGPATGFDLRFYLKQLPFGGVLRKESMQLFCTPIINLFARTCRIDRDQTRVEYPVEAPEAREIANRDYFEIFSIDSVRSFESAGASNREYPRYDDLRARSAPGKQTFWYARRRASIGPENKRTFVLLSFVDEGKQPGLPADPTVTVEATCTNLDLPARLPSLALRLHRVAPVSAVEPVAPTTRAQPPPPSREYHWRLISQLALNHLPIGDLSAEPGTPRTPGPGTLVLREILRLSDPLGNDVTRRQIEAIRHVESRHEFRSLPQDRRAIVGGVCVTIDFGEEAIAQTGLLLPEVIAQFLAHHVSINAFSRLIATVGQKKVREWEPRSGEKILL